MPKPDPVWWRVGPQDVQQVSERITSLYVERCHLDRDENGIVIVNRERTIRVPAAMLAVLLLGPGTRITQAAVTLLADSATALCWVGEQGVRCYASGAGASRGAGILRRQAWLVSRKPERLAVARQMYAMRFPNEDVSGLTMQQLRGREGARVKRIYREESDRTGVPWKRREYKAGDAFGAGDEVNRLMSAGHSCLYGIVYAAVAGIGASPGLGFVHSTGWQSFVLDIADLYKADSTIPIAFDLAAAGCTEERDMRLAMRDYFVDNKLLPKIIRDIKYLLLADDVPDDAPESHSLWDEELGSVPGGLNWADRTLYAVDDELPYQSVVGPELPEVDPF